MRPIALLLACGGVLQTAPAQARPRADSLIAANARDISAALVTFRMPPRTALGLHEFKSERDSLEWAGARELADRATEYRVIVSLLDRTLWVLLANDTLLATPIAVASGLTLEYAGRTWTFRTPRGRHTVRRKVVDPQWAPPDWAYAEAALEHDLSLKALPSETGVTLKDGSTLVVRDSVVGILSDGDTRFQSLPLEEHVVFDSTLFIPPLGTRNRRLSGELGRFALDLGDGYLLHGTNQALSIGTAVTHGCIRIRDEELAWLHEHVPVGTPVYIY
jgi:hypothetical protein